jgi:hypothetical protein
LTPITDLQLQQLVVLRDILASLSGLTGRVDALESGKANASGLIEIEGEVDGVPAIIAGVYETQ